MECKDCIAYPVCNPVLTPDGSECRKFKENRYNALEKNFKAPATWNRRVYDGATPIAAQGNTIVQRESALELIPGKEYPVGLLCEEVTLRPADIAKIFDVTCWGIPLPFAQVINDEFWNLI